MRSFLPLSLLVLSLSAFAEERVLIPVAYTGPGAYGATWTSDIVAVNRSSEAWRPGNIQFQVVCPIPEGCFLHELAPGAIGDVISGPFTGPLNAPHGIFLTVPEGLAISEHISTIARAPYLGTLIPTPRESEFRTTPLFFPAVPVEGTRVRTLLRVYGSNVSVPMTVRVRLVQRWISQPEVFAERTITLMPSESADAPAYAELSLQSAFCGVLGATISDVEVVADIPSDSNAKIWAMITTTDFSTNEIMVIAPM
jgi:hypothetical protein